MNKLNTNKIEILKIINELEIILNENYDISIPELKKLKNIFINENANPNIERFFNLAYRRIQEVGIYNDDVDSLFKKFYQLITN